MVADRTGDLVGQAPRQQTPGEPPRDRQRDVLSTGCQWRPILKVLPPRSTAFAYLDLWIYDGTLDRIHYALYGACRERTGREAGPAACIIAQSSFAELRMRA
jgi:transposase